MDLTQCFSTIDLLLLKLIYVILCCFLSHFLTSLCSQVFWLSIDYLAVAKSAVLPQHIEILVSAVTHINEPDSLYGIILSNKLFCSMRLLGMLETGIFPCFTWEIIHRVSKTKSGHFNENLHRYFDWFPCGSLYQIDKIS
ncbi:uncharacterized protein LOC133829061 [Humulus lupulus]|uniref:uncharacterized protein LOC133829061 n=1 Tax=Humulus lupulus TaxID=3486 RepID=UPI002B414C83|nr:uncharacterized protein LOC133829061 [Humulus lupulus]